MLPKFICSPLPGCRRSLADGYLLLGRRQVGEGRNETTSKLKSERKRSLQPDKPDGGGGLAVLAVPFKGRDVHPPRPRPSRPRPCPEPALLLPGRAPSLGRGPLAPFLGRLGTCPNPKRGKEATRIFYRVRYSDFSLSPTNDFSFLGTENPDSFM